MNNRIKTGIKVMTSECYTDTLNTLTKQFVRSAIGAAIAFFVLGFIFPDKEEETNENE